MTTPEDEAKQYAGRWTRYCKEIGSMAYASATENIILLQYRKFGQLEERYLLHVIVLDSGLEIDGIIYSDEDMPAPVQNALEAYKIDAKTLAVIRQRQIAGCP